MASKHIVKQGEYLSTIATRHGFLDWKRIYDHPDNAEFRKRRPNPNVILPGDELAIPDRQKAVYTIQTGRTHTFVLKRPPPSELILRLHAVRGEPIVGEAFDIEFDTLSDADPSQVPLRMTTTETGDLRVPIPPGATRATITAVRAPKLSRTVAIGHLDPVRDMHRPFDVSSCILVGIQARLNNLGFKCGDVDGVLGPKTRAALRDFQESALGRTRPNGALDQETCDKLEELHGV